MKKSLVLAMAMALGVTASAYAANPFTDVPAGHWAYDSISKLAAAGVIEGYGDDTFRGDRLMTRYEMAQIVAKAMAKGANVDKLAAEFADELDALGVRVAALEKKSDNVKITGAVRYHYASYRGNPQSWAKGGGAMPDGKTRPSNITGDSQLRTRITFNGKINDTWNYYGTIENRNDLMDNIGDEKTSFKWAYLDGRLGGVKVRAGRTYLTRDPGGNIYDETFDGIVVSYGDKITLEGYYGKLAQWCWRNNSGWYGQQAWAANNVDYDHAWGVNASGKLGKNVTLYAGYDVFKDKDEDAATAEKGSPDDNGIFDVGITGKFGDFKADFVYLHSNADDKYTTNKKGYVGTIGYKGANFKKPGSWGLEAKYYKLGDGVVVTHTMNGWVPFGDPTGFKGYKLAANYTIAKGMMLGIEYYDLKNHDNKDQKQRTLWTELQVRF